MKIRTALTGLVILVASACSDDESPYNCKSCVNEPDAIAANDASGKGVYKGTIVGSTGYIKFVIANADATLSATLFLDGKSYPLTTEATYDGGFEGYFYGTMSSADDIVIGFYVNADGTDYGLFGVVIPGHSGAEIYMLKEFSTSLVAVFEGTFSGDAQGVINMVVVDGEWVALSREQSEQEASLFYGSISESGVVSCPNCDGVLIDGKVSGDTITGTWEDVSDDSSGKWTVKRTL